MNDVQQINLFIAVMALCILALTVVGYISMMRITTEVGKAGFCNDLIKQNESVNGYYKSDYGYCVFTQGRTPEEINKTECHEYCHFLIDKATDPGRDRKHFCGE